MAILDKFETQVLIDDAPAEEYDDNQENSASSPKKVVKYIEARSEMRFAVSFRILPGYSFDCDHLEWSISIDGNNVHNPIVLRSRYDYTKGFKDTRKHAIYETEDGNGYMPHAFQFAKLETRDTSPLDRGKDLKSRYDDLGTIQILVRRFDNARKTSPCPGKRSSLPQDIGTVPEKALKGRAISHSVNLREDNAAVTRSWYTGDRLDKSPIATFVFRYRSRDSLQKSLIIARSPSPIPLEERDPNTLTLEEARILVQRQRDRDGAKSECDNKTSLKRESTVASSPSHRKYKMSRTSSGQPCIDLDSDNEEGAGAEERAAPHTSGPTNIEILDLI